LGPPRKTFEIIDDLEMLDDIIEAAYEALDWLGLGDKRPAAGQSVAAIDFYVVDLINQKRKDDSSDGDPEEQAFVLGCLWGQQLVSFLQWEWIKVKFDKSTFVIGVASPDQSLVIYPFLCLLECLEGDRPVAIYRSFQILTEPGRVPKLPAGGLENVMDHV
jgi:hypothetical protein